MEYIKVRHKISSNLKDGEKFKIFNDILALYANVSTTNNEVIVNIDSDKGTIYVTGLIQNYCVKEYLSNELIDLYEYTMIETLDLPKSYIKAFSNRKDCENGIVLDSMFFKQLHRTSGKYYGRE